MRKKFIRANEVVPYVTKTLKKAIMERIWKTETSKIIILDARKISQQII